MSQRLSLPQAFCDSSVTIHVEGFAAEEPGVDSLSTSLLPVPRFCLYLTSCPHER